MANFYSNRTTDELEAITLRWAGMIHFGRMWDGDWNCMEMAIRATEELSEYEEEDYCHSRAKAKRAAIIHADLLSLRALKPTDSDG